MSQEPTPQELPVTTVQRLADTSLPTRHGTFRMTAYRDGTGEEHLVLSVGITETDPPTATPPLVRVHSECLTGDALGSRRCDCGEQLQHALHLVAREGCGALVYVRGHEGRGIGLVEKLRAYALQDAGLDTVDANLELGHPADARTYDQTAAMLADLGVHRIRLLSSNPAKEEALTALGVEVVARQALIMPARPENEHYLRTKRDRMGHDRVAAGEWHLLLAGTVPTAGVLAERYGDLVRPGGPAVVAQLGQSLDGFIASRTGDARFVTGEEDREHLHRLRALVDAVVVGATTAAADDARLTVRAVAGQHPVRVVLDPRGVLPADATMLVDGTAPTVWVVGPSVPVPEHLAPHVEVVVWPEEGAMEPVAVLALLRDRGLGRVLVEGGGRLVSAFVRAGVVDRLYLTTAPLLIGDGVPGLRVAGADRLDDALRPPVRRWVLGEDVVTEFDLTGAEPVLLRSVGEDEQVDVVDPRGETA
ncbi:GTP cyclohydrolase II [Ornithinimicrobium sp. LYQ103]|uniref:GTP cyclohydrolase II n=1 Tax=Ornithinimicrobium sp. LYQ103 TaxID=3378796 RepID=UPI0038531DF1